MIDQLNGDFLQWLRGFYYIAQTGSIRKAAEKMNRNPSTLSYQLRCLEQELNAVLFDRYKKTLRITEEGSRLLKWTITTFETLKSLRSDVCAAPGEVQGTVSISTSLPLAIRIAPVVARFRERFPKVIIRMRRALTYEIVNDVEESRVDFGLTGITANPMGGSELKLLFRSRPRLVIRWDNKFGVPDHPMPEDLDKLPFVTFLSDRMDESGDPYFGLNDEIAPYTKRSVLSVNNFHLMLRFVLMGTGVCIMDGLCMKASTSFGDRWSMLRDIPLDHILPPTRYGVLMLKRKHVTPQAGMLLQWIERYLYMSLPDKSVWQAPEPPVPEGWEKSADED